MKELDELLLGYLARHYPQAPETERLRFEALLELPDPLLWAYVSGRQVAEDRALRVLIDHIVSDRA